MCKHGLRSRKFCGICSKTVREIVQPHIPQKRVVNIPKHNIKSDPTMFIDGSPYVSCGNCGIPTKQFDGDRHIRGTRDNIIKSDTQRKIMVGFIKRSMELVTLDDGDQAFKMISKLILQSKPGCFDCWYRQQRQIDTERVQAEKEKRNIKSTYYKR